MNVPIARRQSLEAAIAQVDALEGHVLRRETVVLAAGAGRVAAAALNARRDGDSCLRALIDGYALAGADTIGASPYNPLPFRLVGTAVSSLARGTASRIAVGTVLPAGADAVLPVDAADDRGDMIEVFATAGPGTGSYREAAPNVDAGRAFGLPAGRVLSPADLAWLAAQGFDSVSVLARPRVRILLLRPGFRVAGADAQGGASGVERIGSRPPVSEPAPDTTGLLLTQLVLRDGGEVEGLAAVLPNTAAFDAALTRPGADLILTVGGTGPGFNDGAIAAFSRIGQLVFHGVNLRPGDSPGLGLVDRTPVLLLPGHPVGAAAGYEALTARLVRRLGGRSLEWPWPLQTTCLARKVASRLGVTDWCRVRVVDAHTVDPLPLSGPLSLAQLAAADGFFWVPPESEGHPPGEPVRICRYV